MGLISHAFDRSAQFSLTVDVAFVYLLVDRDNCGVPPDGKRSGGHKESPPKKEIITPILHVSRHLPHLLFHSHKIFTSV